MSLITLKHGNRHSAGGSDPLSFVDLFDGVSAADRAAARANLGVDVPLALFGDGADGDVTISSGTTTLTRDMFYANLTVAVGAVLDTAGFRVFVTGTLTNNGTIRANGTNASGATGGTQKGSTSPFFGAGGPNGGTGAGSTGGADPNAYQMPGGGSGGAGGAGSGGAGGAGRTINAILGTNGGGLGLWRQMAPCTSGSFGLQYPSGGGSGGSGGGDGANSGGGGGGGGCPVALIARYLAGSGVVESKGGNGGSPSAGNCGGGGGGGGGVIKIMTHSTTQPWTLTVTGGSGGTATGTGVTGTTGSTGNTFVTLGV